MARPPEARLTLIVDQPVAVYSGMVPGFVAGQYGRADLEIDVRPLAMRAGARCIVARATGVDPTARRVLLEGRPPVAYDTVSFDVGSTVDAVVVSGPHGTRNVASSSMMTSSFSMPCASTVYSPHGPSSGTVTVNA